jgi:hypothetical protein
MLASRIHVLLIKAKRDSKSIIGIRVAKRQTGRHRGLPLRMAVGIMKGIDVFRWSRNRLACLCGRTRRSAPTRSIWDLQPIQRLFVSGSKIEQSPVGAGFHACPRTPNCDSTSGQAQRPAPTNGFWIDESHTLQAKDKIRSASQCGRTRRSDPVRRICQ